MVEAKRTRVTEEERVVGGAQAGGEIYIEKSRMVANSPEKYNRKTLAKTQKMLVPPSMLERKCHFLQTRHPQASKHTPADSKHTNVLVSWLVTAPPPAIWADTLHIVCRRCSIRCLQDTKAGDVPTTCYLGSHTIVRTWTAHSSPLLQN